MLDKLNRFILNMNSWIIEFNFAASRFEDKALNISVYLSQEIKDVKKISLDRVVDLKTIYFTITPQASPIQGNPLQRQTVLGQAKALGCGHRFSSLLVNQN